LSHSRKHTHLERSHEHTQRSHKLMTHPFWRSFVLAPSVDQGPVRRRSPAAGLGHPPPFQLDLSHRCHARSRRGELPHRGEHPPPPLSSLAVTRSQLLVQKRSCDASTFTFEF
jgi:hypothetical protein